MSNDIKYFQDLLAEMEELQSIHKGVSITGKKIAQTSLPKDSKPHRQPKSTSTSPTDQTPIPSADALPHGFIYPTSEEFSNKGYAYDYDPILKSSLTIPQKYDVLSAYYKKNSSPNPELKALEILIPSIKESKDPGLIRWFEEKSQGKLELSTSEENTFETAGGELQDIIYKKDVNPKDYITWFNKYVFKPNIKDLKPLFEAAQKDPSKRKDFLEKMEGIASTKKPNLRPFINRSWYENKPYKESKTRNELRPILEQYFFNTTLPQSQPSGQSQSSGQPKTQTQTPLHKDWPNGYPVKAGDTLSSIAARMYKTKDPQGWKTLAAYNKITNVDKIQVNQVIQIPAQIDPKAQATSNYKAKAPEEKTKDEVAPVDKKDTKAPAGQTPAGQTPAGQTPAGQTPAGQTPEEKAKVAHDTFKELLSEASDQDTTKGYIDRDTLSTFANQMKSIATTGNLTEIWNALNLIAQEKDDVASQLKGYPFPDLADLATYYQKAKQFKQTDWDVLPNIEKFYGNVDKKGNVLPSALRSLVKKYVPDLSGLGTSAQLPRDK